MQQERPSGSQWGPAREAPWVLIVEDRLDVVQLLVMLVSSMSGMTLRNCVTVDEALEIVQQHAPPAVAVCDLLSTGRNGLDIARKIRTMPYGEETRVVFLAEALTDTCRNAVAEVDPFAVLNKPVDLGVLQDTIQDALESWSIG